VLAAAGPRARAQEFATWMILSDTEIEATLQDYARPLLLAGGLPPDKLRIGMVVDDSINAFATAGNRIFFNTGLLLKADNSNEVIGVMAHEIGHVAGGHTVTASDGTTAPTAISLLATLLGVAAGVAAGSPDLGIALMMGGQRAAIGEYLSFSRGVESRADQFALQALERSKQSAEGLYSFFNRLAGEELLITERGDPYLRTHPMSRERMATIRAAIDRSAYRKFVPDPELEERHRRMTAKLFAFLKPQYATLQRYPETDTSVPARYARAIAHYRRGQFDKALPVVDDLLKDRPADPYFWQIKGDMQLSRAKPDEAIIAYREALKLVPNATEILNAKAHAMVESGDPGYAAEAEETLKRSAALEPENPYTWDLLARSYSLAGNQGMSAYAAAEKAVLIGQFGDVARYTMQADKLLEKGTPTWYRLQDIKIVVQNHLRDMKERRR
jgi:predicted Zn-dependent protease